MTFNRRQIPLILLALALIALAIVEGVRKNKVTHVLKIEGPK